MNTNVGIVGEYRAVVTKADGSIKEDTGYQKNLILDQGLDFFGGGKGEVLNAKCVIGSGNSAPAVNQTHLDSVVAITEGTDKTDNYAYVDEGDNLYKMWEQKKYRFEGLNSVNISEVGLTSSYSDTTSNYFLTTRALIKDAGGAPTTITINTGETLDIYYKVHKVIDTQDKEFVVNMLDGGGGITPYNVVVRPSYVGSALVNRVTAPYGVSNGTGGADTTYGGYSSSELGNINSIPRPYNNLEKPTTFTSSGAYVLGSFKRLLNIKLGLNAGNTATFRTFFFIASSNQRYHPFFLLPFQIRFGSVAEDSPIPKTNKHTLTIPLEVSWGRYEGEL